MKMDKNGAIRPEIRTFESGDAPGLAVERASVVYANGHRALVDMSFSLPQGAITALVGMNGSGKSTLFKAIMGFIPLSSGSVSLFGNSIKTAIRRNLVAYVPQNEEVDWNFPALVEDVVMMGRYGHMGFLRRPSALDRAKVDEALEKVGLSDLRKRQIGELSGGQKKRVFLARAMAQEGRVTLLDEPFAGIDVKSEEAIIGLMRMMRDEGAVVLVSTHDLGSVPEYCDYAVLINRTIVAEGPVATTFTRNNLEKAFGGVLRHVSLPDSGNPEQAIGVMADYERPLVLFGKRDAHD